MMRCLKHRVKSGYRVNVYGLRKSTLGYGYTREYVMVASLRVFERREAWSVKLRCDPQEICCKLHNRQQAK